MKITFKKLTAQEMIDSNITKSIYVNPFLSVGSLLLLGLVFLGLKSNFKTSEVVQNNYQTHYKNNK